MPEDIAGAVFATGYWVGKEIRWPHTDVGIDSSRLRGGLGAGFTTKARRSPSFWLRALLLCGEPQDHGNKSAARLGSNVGSLEQLGGDFVQQVSAADLLETRQQIVHPEPALFNPAKVVNDLAAVHHAEPVAGIRRLVHGARDHEGRQSVAGDDLLAQTDHLIGAFKVERRAALVEMDHRRLEPDCDQ